MFLPRSCVCDEAVLEGFVEEVTKNRLRDLNPWPFHGVKKVVAPPLLVIFLNSSKKSSDPASNSTIVCSPAFSTASFNA